MNQRRHSVFIKWKRKRLFKQLIKARSLRRWIPDFANNWTKIKLETYELIYKTAAERYQEILDESESITTKSFRILVGISAVIAFSTSYLEKDNLSILFWIAMTILAIADLGVLIYLLHPKDIVAKGFRPDELIPKNLDNPGDEEFQRHILYYSMIVLIQDRIVVMVIHNRSRGKYYNLALILTVIIIALLMYGVILSLNSPAGATNCNCVIQN